ncbi:Uncharacterised protein [Serratia proteamaculans]|nr:Uncharacterised protein [Serratia proteamaculans]
MSGAHPNIIGGTYEEAIEVDPTLLKTAFVVVETAAAAREDAGGGSNRPHAGLPPA